MISGTIFVKIFKDYKKIFKDYKKIFKDYKKIFRLQIALAICYGLVKYLVFDKITRFLTPISLEIMSVLICAVTYRLFRVI